MQQKEYKQSKETVSKNDMLSIGIVGSGVFGGYHAAKYIGNPFVKLTATYDLDLDRAKKLAHLMNKNIGKDDCEYFDNFDEFLDHVDCVCIATPALTHFDFALRSLQNGKDCFVEKPLSITEKQAEILVKLAKENELILQVGHQERYVLKALGIIPLDKKPKEIICQRIGPYSGRGTDVSVVYDLMIHDLDLCHQLTKSKLAEIDCEFSYIKDNLDKENADEADVKITLEDGTILKLLASRKADRQERTLEIFFDEGDISVNFLTRKVENNTELTLADFDEIDENEAIKDPLGLGAKYFINAIRNNTEPVVSGEHGRLAVKWAEMIHKNLHEKIKEEN